MASRKIVLQADGIRKDEAKAGAAGIYPGMLIKHNSSGEVIVHATSGGIGLRMLAIEDLGQGKTVDDVYASGDQVTFVHVRPGYKTQVLLKASENVAIGDVLISAGTGKFIKTTGTPSQNFCIAKEASNVAADTLIMAEWF